VDQQPPSDAPTPPPEPLPDGQPESPAAAAATHPASPADDLPEWEPLTPELLEDEAIRGDFVLRWAVVGLALLIGCTEIFDARALVHVRSGTWLATHGWLPPANDPFSITAADRRWVNLSWGFDLLSAGVHAVSGGVGLSLMKGLLVALAIGLLVHCVRPGIRTWWGSLCGALVLLAAYSQWEWQPDLMTFLGVACLMWLLVTSETPRPRLVSPWLFPVLLLVWGQLDPRAWIGLLILLLYVLGRGGGRSVSEATWDAPAGPGWRFVGVSAVALLVHPFLWETWLAPVSQYGVEYPALRMSYPRPMLDDRVWYPLWSAVVWQDVNHRLVASLLLMAAALLSLLLNLRRASLSHWFCFLGVNTLACLTTHELAVASLVNGVLATVQAQEWYKSRFGQIYSLAWQDVLFSRGGRAITVAGFFGLAWVLISGRLDGPDAHRTGLGISPSLQQEIDDFRRLDDVAFDLRGFHFTLGQGDALIAAGRASFVDHRVRIFSDPEAPDLLVLHDRVRKSLRSTPGQPPDALAQESREEVFQNYAISHALPRLTSEALPPDYQTMLDLLSSKQWVLTDLLPTTAIFHRMTAVPSDLGGFAQKTQLNVIDRAFRTDPATTLEPRDRPIPAVWSQTLLSQPKRWTGQGTQLAQHWLTVLQSVPTSPMPFQMGIAVLATRSAQQGVTERPDLPRAYLVLSECESIWQRLEAVVLAEYQLPWTQSSRYYEAVAAARQAAELAPQDPRPQMRLIELYQSAGLADVTYEAIQAFLANNPKFGIQSDAELAQRESLLQLRGRLMEVVAESQQQAEKALADQADRLQVASLCRQSGCLKLALKTLQDDAVYVERNPFARLELSQWLAELGAGVELDDSAASLAAIGPGLGASTWHEPVAYSALSRADFLAARDAWQEGARDLDLSRLQSLLITAPGSLASPVWLGDAQYPVSHMIAVQEAVSRQAGQATLWDLYRSLAALEQGDLNGARGALKESLQRYPESPLRPLLRLYWFCFTAEILDEEPPSDWIPIEASMFATE